MKYEKRVVTLLADATSLGQYYGNRYIAYTYKDIMTSLSVSRSTAHRIMSRMASEAFVEMIGGDYGRMVLVYWPDVRLDDSVLYELYARELAQRWQRLCATFGSPVAGEAGE